MNAHLITFDDVDQVLSWLTANCLEFGTPIAPRNEPTFEMIGTAFRLANPRARITGSASRKWSLPLAFGELCWHLRGASDLANLSYYAPRWGKYSDDKKNIGGSCYGKTIFEEGEASQWNRVKRLLKEDNSTRRAILVFDQSRDSDFGTLDKSCLTSMQFLIRDERLHAVVSMRSNDIYLGVPYDVFNFTMFQEIMALELGMRLGTYVHFAGSMHLYERDIQRARDSYLEAKGNATPMESMPSLESLYDFVNFESSVRSDRPASLDDVHAYWRPYADALKEFKRKKSSVLAV